MERYMQHIYNSEDALYQILYDKAHRPAVYRAKIAANTQVDVSEEDKRF